MVWSFKRILRTFKSMVETQIVGRVGINIQSLNKDFNSKNSFLVRNFHFMSASNFHYTVLSSTTSATIKKNTHIIFNKKQTNKPLKSQARS